MGDRLYLGLALAVGLLLRFINLSKASIWHDEGFTMMLVQQDLGNILLRTGRDVHPPLHYLLLHFWIKIFGNSELAARSLSVLFGLITIAATFFLVKRLFGSAPARLAAVFMAIGPFLVRYSQEARMWGLLATLVALSSFYLVRYFQEHRTKDMLVYGVLVAAALYTQYYAIFAIAFHWLFVVVHTIHPNINWKRGLFNKGWWVGNILAAALFAPWLPVAYSQFARVQGGFWIPPVGPHTIPSTFAQFMTFTDMGVFPLYLRLSLFTGFVALLIYAAWRNRKELSSWALMLLYLGFGPVAVFILSLKRPIYVDRYFVFSAIGFYATLAVLHYAVASSAKFKRLRQVSILTLVVVMAIGIRNVYAQSNHQMRRAAAYVNSGFTYGDAVVSGDIYSYFDFSYYNRTNQPVMVLVPGGGFPGCCEGRSMLYDRPELVVKSLDELAPLSGRVWIVGKTGKQDYFDKVPPNWQPEDRFEAGYSAVRRYRIN
jgi:uncharacterized membrane protein